MAKITTRRLKRTWAGLYRSLTVAWKLIDDLSSELKHSRREMQSLGAIRRNRRKPSGQRQLCRMCGKNAAGARWRFICKACRAR